MASMHCIIWDGPLRNRRPVSSNYKRVAFNVQRRTYEATHGVRLGQWERVDTLCHNDLCVAPDHIVRRSTVEHFWSYVDVRAPADCWPWTMGTMNGYGRYVVDRRTVQTHRIAWESVNGPIPDGLVIDHLCRNRLCQNPAHMEPVPPAENTRRGTSAPDPLVCRNGHTKPRRGYCPTCQAASVARYQARVASGALVPRRIKDVCVNGHDKEGRGACRQCGRAASLRFEARKRAAT